MLLVGVALLIGYGIGYRHARRQRLASLGHVLERRLAGRSADGALLAAQIQAEVDGRPMIWPRLGGGLSLDTHTPQEGAADRPAAAPASSPSRGGLRAGGPGRASAEASEGTARRPDDEPPTRESRIPPRGEAGMPAVGAGDSASAPVVGARDGVPIANPDQEVPYAIAPTRLRESGETAWGGTAAREPAGTLAAVPMLPIVPRRPGERDRVHGPTRLERADLFRPLEPWEEAA